MALVNSSKKIFSLHITINLKYLSQNGVTSWINLMDHIILSHKYRIILGTSLKETKPSEIIHPNIFM